MTKLQQFMAAGPESLSLQVKFLKEERRIAKDSMYGLKYPVHPESLAIRETGTIQRLPESIWMLAHKIVAFSQSYVQQAKWSTGILNWMFVREPWWTLVDADQARYADLFNKADWFAAMDTLTEAHRRMLKHVESHAVASEKQALLWFLNDSRMFAEQMYRRL